MNLVAPALAVAFVLAASTDWELQIVNCAKSRETCEAARMAIAEGKLPDVAPGTATRCQPHPNCFSTRSDCIAGLNCP